MYNSWDHEVMKNGFILGLGLGLHGIWDRYGMAGWS